MKLSLRSEYALLFLIQLSRSGESSVTTQLATSQHIPAESLAEILSVLSQAGYVEQAQDRARLARNAEKISVAEIIRLFDGALAPLEPVSNKGYAPAPMDNEAKLTGLFEQIQAQILARLEKTTIAELA